MGQSALQETLQLVVMVAPLTIAGFLIARSRRKPLLSLMQRQ
jgi:hypothetical protein